MPGELSLPLALGKITPHAGGHRGALDQASKFLIVKSLKNDDLTAAGYPPKQWSMGDAAELEPSFERHDWAGLSAEPWPISTSRQPFLPRRVKTMPRSRISIQPRPSSVCSAPISRPINSERRSPPAKPRSRIIAVVDGLKGFPDAINAAFPETTVQTCIVHLLRQSLDFVSYKDRKPIAAALKDIYRGRRRGRCRGGA